MRARLAVVLLGTLFAPVAASADGADAVVFTHVAVVDVEHGRVHDDQTVLVRGDRIDRVGPAGAVPVPPRARTIDGRGRFLIPGLCDMHVHVFRNVSLRPPNTRVFPLFIANGITCIREMWTRPDEMPTVRAWREAVARGTLLAPHVVAAGTLVDGAPPVWRHSATLARPDQVPAFVATLVRAGVEFIKPYENLSHEVYLALAREGRARGLPVAGHVPIAVSAVEAADAGQRSEEHLLGLDELCLADGDLTALWLQSHAPGLTPPMQRHLWAVLRGAAMRTFDAARCRRVAAHLAQRGTWVVPTLVVHAWESAGDPRALVSDPRLAYIAADDRASWRDDLDAATRAARDPAVVEQRRLHAQVWRREVASMHAGGVAILAGTDYDNPWLYPGFSLHDELQALVDAGLTPAEALAAATIGPARFVGATNAFGTVAPGRRADLVLLSANPLAAIGNTRRIEGVMLNGRYLDRARLDALLRDSRVPDGH